MTSHTWACKRGQSTSCGRVLMRLLLVGTLCARLRRTLRTLARYHLVANASL